MQLYLKYHLKIALKVIFYIIINNSNMTQTISFTVKNKYKKLINNNTQINKIAWDFFEDYFEELRQDNITREKLEANMHDKELNNKISQKLWIS